MENELRILSTKQLSPKDRKSLDEVAWVYDFDLIKTKAVPCEKRTIHENIIFTGFQGTQYGVEWLGTDVQEKRFFCVGKKSEFFLTENELEVYGFSDYAEPLANLLIEYMKEKSFTYICGEDRLETLPKMLKKAGVEFNEYHVYKGEVEIPVLPEKINILFWFSPKGVRNLIEKIDLSEVQWHVCIGKTTAAELSKYIADEVSKKILFPEVPAVSGMIDLIRSKVESKV